MTRRHRTPLHHVIAPLLRRALTVRTVLDRYFGDHPLHGRVLQALTHGDLTTCALDPSRSRGLETKAARRMLATLLIHLEALDENGAAFGSKIWQGSIACRLGLSTRRRARTETTPAGPLGGIKEVQRYVAIFECAGVIKAHQPNAERVPDKMRARPRLSIVRGAAVVRRWSYNVVRLLGDLPASLRALMRPGPRITQKDRAKLEARAQAALRAKLAKLETFADGARAVLEYIQARPRIDY
jgi:hypothetical protein